jgi:hypothetical protein
VHPSGETLHALLIARRISRCRGFIHVSYAEHFRGHLDAARAHGDHAQHHGTRGVDVPYVTEEIRRLIGVSTPPQPAYHPIEASEVRRFHQATMDGAPRYMDPEAARRYGGIVAPPAFPTVAHRRLPQATDPLDDMGKPDFDGLQREFRPGLPPVQVSLPRYLNAGYEYEFFRYARIGERVVCTSTYRDIYEKESRNGSMVFIVIEDMFTTETGERLIKVLQTGILR